jgi:pimeloyl-ACP methyl ester carboxylesterase
MTSADSSLDASAITLHRQGDGPPLVLLHCLGVDHRFWDFAAELCADFTLLRYDLPGHGASAVPATPYGIADLSAQLAEILAAHKIPRVHRPAFRRDPSRSRRPAHPGRHHAALHRRAARHVGQAR